AMRARPEAWCAARALEISVRGLASGSSLAAGRNRFSLKTKDRDNASSQAAAGHRSHDRERGYRSLCDDDVRRLVRPGTDRRSLAELVVRPPQKRKATQFMIMRVWQGRVPADKAPDYFMLMRSTGLPDYRATPGNIS